MIEKAADIIFKRIVNQNRQEVWDAIPASDSFLLELMSSTGYDQKTVKEAVAILRDSHKILIMQIVKPDEGRGIDRVEGYVDADLSSIKRLKEYYYRALCDKYEEQFHKRHLAHQIIQELFPRMDLYNNTLIGYLLNKSIMLEEFEKLIVKNYVEYSEDWKLKKFNGLVEKYRQEKQIQDLHRKRQDAEEKEFSDKKTKVMVKQDSERAVDSGDYGEYTKMTSGASLSKVLQIYGVEFFFRVNLRKYNFEFITRVIENREIDRKSDLTLLKNMITKVKSNIHRDQKLIDYLDEINALERTVGRALRTVAVDR